MAETFTQTLLFRLPKGRRLDDKDGKAPADVVWKECTDLAKGGEGFLRQFWGHQVEDETLFIWFNEWESSDALGRFRQSPGHGTLISELGKVFDSGAGPPITFGTYFEPGDQAALESPFTAMALFSLPNDTSDEVRREATTTLSPTGLLKEVVAVGRSKGVASGRVNETSGPPLTPEGDSISIQVLFGWNTIEENLKWRASGEHAKIGNEVGGLAAKWGLKPVALHGKYIAHFKLQARA